MGIKDICYTSLFAKEDVPLLRKLSRKIQATHDQRLVDDFNNACQRKWDDHNPMLQIGNDYVTLEQVAKADDLVLTVGINKSIDLILATGAGADYWDYVFVGTGTTPAAITDVGLGTVLIPGSVQISLTGNGWREYAGTSLRIAAIFGESFATATINEAGIRNAGGVYLNHCVFSNFPISHTINVTGFVVSFVIEFVPVM